MKKIIIALALTLSLTGCAGLVPANVNTAVNNINTTVAEVQTIAREVCSFVPAASTVSNLLSQFIPGLTTAQSIAERICAAVAPAGVATARRGHSVPMVAGVPIRGRFVSR